jgi:flagellar assembly protein FliH
METRRPYMFDQSFDLSAMKAEETKKVEPTFSEGDVAAAREAGRQEGLVEGRAAATREISQQQAELLSHVERLMQRLSDDVWKVYAQQKQAASDIALTIVRKLLPDYVKKYGMQEMTSAIEASIAEMINEPRLVLRVPDPHFDFISKEVNTIADKLGYGGKIIVLADPNLGEHDCRLEWADGGMERNLNLTWSEIERQVARHGSAQNLANNIPPQEGLPSSTTSIAV